MSRSLVGAEIARVSLLREALRWADVVHFNFGRSIAPQRIEGTRLDETRPRLAAALKGIFNSIAGPLEYRDVDLLSRRGKVIAVTFQGDDIRQYDRMLPDNIAKTELSRKPDNAARRRRAAQWSKRADLMFALNPDLLRLLPPRAEFQPYASVDAKQFTPAPRQSRGAHLRLVHAPTSRSVKGTRFLLDAVQRLAVKGIHFDLDLVEGVPHEEALRRYARADIVVDQLLLGWYGALAVEALALGKPVIAFVADEDLAMTSLEMQRDMPIVRADHRSIAEVLEDLSTWQDERLARVGRSSRAFALKYHDPDRIAAALLGSYERAVSLRRSGERMPV